METEQKFYVYVDYREDDGKPFYVGKGSIDRVKFLERNKLHTNIKNKHGMFRKILLETDVEQEAFDKEIQLIQELRTHVDFGEGGANLTIGGEGASGYKYSLEQRKQRKERWEDPDLKLKRSELTKKSWEDPDYQKFMKEMSKKTWENPDYQRKIKEARKKTWDNPEFREQHKEKLKKAYSDPELREKIRKITKEKLSDPETKRKISENLKIAFQKMSPEERSRKAKKAAETKRLKKLQLENEKNNSTVPLQESPEIHECDTQT